MPVIIQPGERQLTTEDTNQSRLVTKQRWVVEARNGHLRSIFKFFEKVAHVQVLPNLGIISLIHMDGADAALARRFLQRAGRMNDVQARVEHGDLERRNAQRVRISFFHTLEHSFTVLLEKKANVFRDNCEYLVNLTTGVYHVGCTPSYIQDKLQREEGDEIQIEMLKDANRLPEAGFLRLRLWSRFRNAAKYQLWIEYRPVVNQF
ncbi:hypothetical protein QAD02_012681 [Eretmocerus hayati]|uniref:Uncharacterized protein n=1 Tax=Eretmocerus hayati TaxID=131215 RepID=A0ACC2P2Y2_9HYME|nr:hypothetical protein QAD02_012681 [Eretmocerus hayati]